MLWAFWMTPRRSMGETPYSMTYGSEAVITIEVRMKNLPNQQKKKKKKTKTTIWHFPKVWIWWKGISRHDQVSQVSTNGQLRLQQESEDLRIHPKRFRLVKS